MQQQPSEVIDAIKAKKAEQDRLLDTLKYYEWLAQHGLSWDKIKGVRSKGVVAKDWWKIPKEIRDRYNRHQVTKLIDIKLDDGTTIVLPWPPFQDDVIYNRKRM